MKKKIDTTLGTFSIFAGILINTLWLEFNSIIQPNWINIIISMIVSLSLSFSFIFLLLNKAICFIWRKARKQFDLQGDWYILYYAEDYPTTNYIRMGMFNLKQQINCIEMNNLEAHTPTIENNRLVDNKYRDDEDDHHPSTGSGNFQLDIKNNLLIGQYELHRGDKSIVGLLNANIANKTHIIEGHFYNGENARAKKKPTIGKIRMFRSQKDLELAIQKLLRDEEKK